MSEFNLVKPSLIISKYYIKLHKLKEKKYLHIY